MSDPQVCFSAASNPPPLAHRISRIKSLLLRTLVLSHMLWRDPTTFLPSQIKPTFLMQSRIPLPAPPWDGMRILTLHISSAKTHRYLGRTRLRCQVLSADNDENTWSLSCTYSQGRCVTGRNRLIHPVASTSQQTTVRFSRREMIWSFSPPDSIISQIRMSPCAACIPSARTRRRCRRRTC